MDFHISEATPDDSDLLSALAMQTYAEAFGHSLSASDLTVHLETHLSPERLREMLREDMFLLMCVADTTVGFIQFGDAHVDSSDLTEPLEVEPDDTEIRRLYVLAEFQNRGLGTRLMDAALTDHRVVGTITYLDVWEHNRAAQRFYERKGFEKVGGRAFRVASGEVVGVDFVMVRRP